jgi:hypothetical protein
MLHNAVLDQGKHKLFENLEERDFFKHTNKMLNYSVEHILHVLKYYYFLAQLSLYPYFTKYLINLTFLLKLMLSYMCGCVLNSEKHFMHFTSDSEVQLNR